MPGIMGFTRLDPRNEGDRASIERMRDAMVYGSEHVGDPLFIDSRICAARTSTVVGHFRTQPYVEAGIHVWLDGEILADSRNPGLDRHEKIDGARILASGFLDDEGHGFLQHLNGIYAAAVYDSKREKIHLVSDRYGLRHLNWSVWNGRLVWASELKALLELPDFQARIDRNALEEFLGLDWLLKDRTWFEGVELLSPATVLTWDLNRGTAERTRYWSWESIRPLPRQINESEAAEELGRRFRQAVSRRIRDDERVGVTLSGGLDSRAILAATPSSEEPSEPLHAVTFCRPHCDDARIAAMAVRVRKNTVHHLVELNSANWFPPRVAAVWWTDGRKDLKHMAILTAYDRARHLFNYVLDGAGAAAIKGIDVRGSADPILLLKKRFGCDIRANSSLDRRVREYAKETGSIYKILLDSRVRSFNINGPKLATFLGMEYRLPFLDNDFQEFWYALPTTLRMDSRVGFQMLVETFPEFFRRIPWQRTGAPISVPVVAQQVWKFVNRIKYRMYRDLSRLGVPVQVAHNLTDYPNWLRAEPARTFVNDLFTSSRAIYPDFISRNQVLGDWERHLSGSDHSTTVCKYLTLELWLQQIYEKKYRNGVGT